MKALFRLAALSTALFLSSCSLMQQTAEENPGTPEVKKTAQPADSTSAATAPDTASAAETAAPATTPTEVTAPVPTAEQQQAAQELLTAEPASTPVSSSALEETPDETAAPTFSGGSLRMGGIAPQEEPASVSDAPAPGANTVELRGLRSPKLPAGLPMNINGKLNGQR